MLTTETTAQELTLIVVVTETAQLRVVLRFFVTIATGLLCVPHRLQQLNPTITQFMS